MEQRVYPVSEAAKARTRTSKAQYEALTAAAQADNAAFWAKQALSGPPTTLADASRWTPRGLHFPKVFP